MKNCQVKENKKIENYEKKILIGRKAADLVKDGDSIVIDIGTTTLEFAKFFEGKKDNRLLPTH